MLDWQAARGKPVLRYQGLIFRRIRHFQGLADRKDTPVAVRLQHKVSIERNLTPMSEFTEGYSRVGKASLHVVLAALGLLAILAVAGWTAYANHYSRDGLACRDRGGRMAWSGCTEQPTHLSSRR
jgi:hypothetical protein